MPAAVFFVLLKATHYKTCINSSIYEHKSNLRNHTSTTKRNRHVFLVVECKINYTRMSHTIQETRLCATGSFCHFRNYRFLSFILISKFASKHDVVFADKQVLRYSENLSEVKSLGFWKHKTRNSVFWIPGWRNTRYLKYKYLRYRSYIVYRSETAYLHGIKFIGTVLLINWP